MLVLLDWLVCECGFHVYCYDSVGVLYWRLLSLNCGLVVVVLLLVSLDFGCFVLSLVNCLRFVGFFVVF